MLEKQIEQYLVRQARHHGWLCYKFVSPSHRGVPDRLLIAPGGRTLFVELKAPHGRLTKLQTYHAARLIEQGADVRVAYCKNDVDAVFA